MNAPVQDTVTITYTNLAPTVVITTPTAGATFAAGEVTVQVMANSWTIGTGAAAIRSPFTPTFGVEADADTARMS